MPCVLRVNGPEFEPESFLRDSDLEADPVYHRGDPKLPSRPKGPTWGDSGFHVAVSDVGFDDLPGQIREAIQFLEENEPELRRLARFPGVEDAGLDFGIARRDVAVQSDFFPPALLSLAGRLNFYLMLSLYPISNEDSEQ